MVNEDRVLELVRGGKSFGQTAIVVGCSKATIKRICQKYGVKSQYKFGGTHEKSFWDKLLGR